MSEYDGLEDEDVFWNPPFNEAELAAIHCMECRMAYGNCRCAIELTNLEEIADEILQARKSQG